MTTHHVYLGKYLEPSDLHHDLAQIFWANTKDSHLIDDYHASFNNMPNYIDMICQLGMFIADEISTLINNHALKHQKPTGFVNFDDVAFDELGLSARCDQSQETLNHLICQAVNEKFSTDFQTDDVWGAIMRLWQDLCETKSEIINEFQHIGDIYEDCETGVAFKLIGECAIGVTIQNTVTKVYHSIPKSYFLTYWHKQNK